jgi:hypothetical protein
MTQSGLLALMLLPGFGWASGLGGAERPARCCCGQPCFLSEAKDESVNYKLEPELLPCCITFSLSSAVFLCPLFPPYLVL